LKDIPIFGLSGHTDKDHDEKCIVAGMAEVYHKPINFRGFIDRITEKVL